MEKRMAGDVFDSRQVIKGAQVLKANQVFTFESFDNTLMILTKNPIKGILGDVEEIAVVTFD